MKWWTQDQKCNFLTSILNLMAGKVSKYYLLCYWRPILSSPRITSLSETFLGQFYEPNHINCEKNKKSGIKIQQHPVHAIVLQNPAQIRSKNTAQLYYFIYTDVNTQMITNHPRISIQIYFICANTITGYQCITRAVKIIRKSRLMLL